MLKINNAPRAVVAENDSRWSGVLVRLLSASARANHGSWIPEAGRAIFFLCVCVHPVQEYFPVSGTGKGGNLPRYGTIWGLDSYS